MPICLSLLRQAIRCARILARVSAGSSNAARMPMMAITTSSSIRVKPMRACQRGFTADEFMRPVQVIVRVSPADWRFYNRTEVSWQSLIPLRDEYRTASSSLFQPSFRLGRWCRQHGFRRGGRKLAQPVVSHEQHLLDAEALMDGRVFLQIRSR